MHHRESREILDQAQFVSRVDSRHPAMRAQLVENVLGVIAHRGWADAQVQGHLGRILAFGQQGEHFDFPLAQRAALVVGGRATTGRRGEITFASAAVGAAHVHKQFMACAVANQQSAQAKPLQPVGCRHEEQLMALDRLMTERHFTQRATLAAVPVAEQVLACQEFPAASAQRARLRITESALGRRIPGHDHPVAVDRVGWFAGTDQEP